MYGICYCSYYFFRKLVLTHFSVNVKIVPFTEDSPLTVQNLQPILYRRVQSVIKNTTMKNLTASILVLALLSLFTKTTAQSNATTSSSSTNAPFEFGKGFWNVYCFNGNMVSNPAKAVLAGKFTETKLNFDSRSRYSITQSPSDANGASGTAYVGNSVGTYHTISYKRVGFTAGFYQIDVPGLDDIGYLLINGVQVWSEQICCKSHVNVWKGNLDSTSTIEFKYVNVALGSAGIMKFIPVDNSALPVSFADVKATKETTGIQVQWATASEKNNDFFTVEKSTDGVTFETITTVKGAGNSNDIRNYTATDRQATNGLSYYRIKQTDFDANITYSEVVSLSTTSNGEMKISPNPGNSGETMFLSFPSEAQEEVTIIVRNLQGQEYVSKTVADTESHELIAISTDSLAPGMYMVIASSENNHYSQKIVVQ